MRKPKPVWSAFEEKPVTVLKLDAQVFGAWHGPARPCAMQCADNLFGLFENSLVGNGLVNATRTFFRCMAPECNFDR